MYRTVIVRRDGRVEISEPVDAPRAGETFETARRHEDVLSVQLLFLVASGPRLGDERWGLGKLYLAA